MTSSVEGGPASRESHTTSNAETPFSVLAYNGRYSEIIYDLRVCALRTPEITESNPTSEVTLHGTSRANLPE